MKNLNFFKDKYKLKRLYLEKLSINHLDDIHEYSTNNLFFKYFEYQSFKKKHETKKYIVSKLRDVKNKKSLWWSIKLKVNQKIIGTICIHDINLSRNTCTIGYGINPDYWGKGYFAETLKGILKVILKKNRFLRCQAVTSKKNLPSINGLKRCGFKIEGVMKKYYASKKKNFDAVILAITI